MEFSSRGFQRNSTPRPAQDSAATGGGGAATPPNGGGSSFPQKAFEHVKDSKFLRTLTIVLSASLLVLFVAMIFGISFSTSSRELAAVDKDNYQVVALADGQAYFGKISGINDKNVVLNDVYYLNNQATGDDATQSNVQLIKRGCEVHSPQDQMVIYREQINFWENLKADGRVASAIKQWKEQNPEGQKCEDEATAPTQQNTSQNGSSNTNDDSTNESSGPASSNDSSSPAAGTSPAGSDAGSDTPQSSDPTQTPTP